MWHCFLQVGVAFLFFPEKGSEAEIKGQTAVVLAQNEDSVLGYRQSLDYSLSPFIPSLPRLEVFGENSSRNSSNHGEYKSKVSPGVVSAEVSMGDVLSIVRFVQSTGLQGHRIRTSQRR